MNEIINDTILLKELIEKSIEYKNYSKYTKRLEENKRMTKLIENIKELQKQIVNKEAKKENKEDLENELDILFSQLIQNKDYIKYLDASKKLNELITNVQNNFSNEYNEIIN